MCSPKVLKYPFHIHGKHFELFNKHFEPDRQTMTCLPYFDNIQTIQIGISNNVHIIASCLENIAV